MQYLGYFKNIIYYKYLFININYFIVIMSQAPNNTNLNFNKKLISIQNDSNIIYNNEKLIITSPTMKIAKKIEIFDENNFKLYLKISNSDGIFYDMLYELEKDIKRKYFKISKLSIELYRDIYRSIFQISPLHNILPYLSLIVPKDLMIKNKIVDMEINDSIKLCFTINNICKNKNGIIYIQMIVKDILKYNKNVFDKKPKDIETDMIKSSVILSETNNNYRKII